MKVPNSQNFQGLNPKPHWDLLRKTHEGSSEQDTKPHALKLRNPKFGPNGPSWKFLAHTLLLQFFLTLISLTTMHSSLFTYLIILYLCLVVWRRKTAKQSHNFCWSVCITVRSPIHLLKSQSWYMRQYAQKTLGTALDSINLLNLSNHLRDKPDLRAQ